MVDAVGSGVPVVSTSVGRAPEIIEQSKTGWLLPEATTALIAGALIEAWKLWPEKLEDMGLLARKSVEGRFEPVHYLDKIEKMCCKLVAQYGKIYTNEKVKNIALS